MCVERGWCVGECAKGESCRVCVDGSVGCVCGMGSVGGVWEVSV